MLDATTSPETHAIIGALMEVHNHLGPGFLERAYQEAVALELDAKGIPFEREVPLPIFYKGTRLETVYRADFVCFGSIILELKAVRSMNGIDDAQLVNYLKASGISLGFLANFGEQSLEWRRMVYRHRLETPTALS